MAPYLPMPMCTMVFMGFLFFFCAGYMSSKESSELPSVGKITKTLSLEHRASSVEECLNYTAVNSVPATPTCSPLNMTMGGK